jgi:hypothetical protein
MNYDRYFANSLSRLRDEVVGSIKPTLEALLPRLKQHEEDAFLEAEG